MAATRMSPRRRARAAAAGGRGDRIVLYVPDTFDPEAHLPERLRPLADYARYILHRIIVGRVHLRRGDNLVHLKHDYLRRFLPRGTIVEIRDALVDSGVISVRKYCRAGEVCYGYRLLPPHDEGFSHYSPTAKPLVEKLRAWRKRESDALRHPVHREMRRLLKGLAIDRDAALASVTAEGFKRSVMVSSIERIARGDIYATADRFGRFHTNLTNLHSSLRRFLSYEGSPLVNLDIANSQPIVFCLLLVNLLSHGGKLGDLVDVEFHEEYRDPYDIEINEDFLSCLFYQQHGQEAGEIEANGQEEADQGNHPENQQVKEEREAKEKREINRDNPILRADPGESLPYSPSGRLLRRILLSQRFPADVAEFINLCEQGILYDELMRRLDIPSRRRKSFKRLFFAQVLFGKVRQTGKIAQLFASDFPTVHKAVSDLKRKDYRQLAYLLQAHESKLVIDRIARRILAELPGAFVGTIHDSILTTPDHAEAVRAIMVEEFGRLGLHPTIGREEYPTASTVGVLAGVAAVP
jgi:hypothetical protein